MTYAKPRLVGYSAIAVIQDINNVPKQTDFAELSNGLPSDPAYQADE